MDTGPGFRYYGALSRPYPDQTDRQWTAFFRRVRTGEKSRKTESGQNPNGRQTGQDIPENPKKPKRVQETDSAVRRRLLISLPIFYDLYLSSSPGCSGNSSGIPLQRSKSASFKLSSHSFAISTSVSIILLISEQVYKLLSGKLGQFLDLKDHYIRCVILGRYDFMIFGR